VPGRLRTALALVVLPLAIAVLAPTGIALALLGVGARPLHRLYVLFGRIALAIGGTPLHLRGREHIEAGASYVVVSNHESGWDPLTLLAALPELALRFVVKAPIMRIPLLGQALRATGNVLVVRTDTAADVRRLEARMASRDPDVSMLFFAEGTRSRDGALHPFKKGPFATAIAHGLPVLPVAVAGTFRVWPKGRLALEPGPVAVEVGAPIPVTELRHEDRDALRARAFEAVKALRAQARNRVRELGVDPGGVDS
jgi:1-acyl-sn-glycerol-3-phosphate acyltransferase